MKDNERGGTYKAQQCDSTWLFENIQIIHRDQVEHRKHETNHLSMFS